MGRIKFRAWDNDKEKMVYSANTAIELSDFFELCEQDLKDTMQYTGLEDRKGKEIYTGDIIKKVGENLGGNFELKPSKIGDIYFVVKMRCGFTLCPISVYGKLAKTCDGDLIPNVWGYIQNYEFWNGADTGTEIIGNIFENKELLK